MAATPRSRPAGFDQLRFERRPAVRWFSPGVLARAGVKVLLADAFGDYLDKRELQDSFPADLTLDLSGRDELWFDYVADTGDGFDATYTVAWAVSQPRLTASDATNPAAADGDAPPAELPRGELLVLGGDEVYPVAKTEDYENRLVGPFEAALPWLDPPQRSSVLAIPGNHDWYDGLTGFMRLFGQKEWLGGRQTCQTRSYFAVALPGRWWLWGIDIQTDAYLDAAQIRYFKGIAATMTAGDRVVLCTAKPSWTAVDTPGAYRNLQYVERRLVPPHCSASLMLSGDSHHYARYHADNGAEKITAGGGGAFLSGTHLLADEIDLPAGRDSVTPHRLVTRYPDAARSRLLAVKALLLPVRNPSFLWVPLVLHLVLFMANQFGLRSVANGSSGNQSGGGGG